MRKAQSSARRHLGAFLDEIIKGQQQYSINQISTLTQTDRASIYQMFSGDRMPTAKFLRELVSLLQLPEEQMQSLYYAYSCCKNGERVASNNDGIRKFFSFLTETTESTALMLLGAPAQAELDALPSTLTSERAIEDALLLLLREEIYTHDKPMLSLILIDSIRQSFLLRSLARCRFPENVRLKVQHIIALHKEQANIAENTEDLLRPLQMAVSLYCHEHLDYDPVILYGEAHTKDRLGEFFPNCYIFSRRVLAVDARGQRAICISDADVAGLYDRMFAERFQHNHCIEMTASEIGQALQTYQTFTSDLEKNTSHYTLSYSPALYPQYTPELLEKYIRMECPNRAAVVQAIGAYYRQWEQINRQTSHMICFSRQGLMDFMTNGTSSEMPPQLIRPVEPEDRRKLLPVLEQQPWNHYVIIKPNQFDVPRYLSVCVTFKSLVFTDERFTHGFSSLVIHDQRYIKLFIDFFNTLQDSGYVFSQQEQKAIWEHVRQ